MLFLLSSLLQFHTSVGIEIELHSLDILCVNSRRKEISRSLLPVVLNIYLLKHFLSSTICKVGIECMTS